MTPVEALQPAIVLLGAGTVAALASRAIRLSPMVGYILAGIAIGPYGLNALTEGDTTHVLAELGVVFLLFDIGLHFSLPEVRNSRKDIFILAPIQMLLCGAVFSVAAYFFGCSWPIAIAIGMSLALSSTAVVTRILGEKGLNSCPLGRSSVAVLIFQDIVAIFLLIFANSLADDPGRLALAMGLAAGQSVLAFLIAAVIGRYVVRPLFHVLASAEVEEVFTMTAVLIVVAASVATGSIGLSLTLGAFLAGMAIADSPYRHSIQIEVAPFRGLLLSFFFLNVGLIIDVKTLIQNLPVVIALSLGIMLIKTALLFLTARLNKWTTPGATQLSFMLAQASEFTLIVLSITAIRIGTPGDGVSLLVAATAISLGLAPVWSEMGMRLSRFIAVRQTHRQGKASAHEAELQVTARKPKVIVFGMTESGRVMLDALSHLDIPKVALDTDARRFVRALADGYDVTYGDSSDFRILDTMNAMEAPVLLLGESRFEISEQMTSAVRQKFPNLVRFVAVESPDERARHVVLGMRARVIKNFMDSVALAGEVLKELNVSEEQISQWTHTMIERHERDDLHDDDDNEPETKSEEAA